MRRTGFFLIALMASAFLAAQPASAQASRTWVSGVGDDANPCSRTAPCKTFAGAISKTIAGGEIDALDPGGFGAVTITKSITIDGGGGQVASVLVAGTNGIVVSAAGATVTLRNLRLNGLVGTAAPGLNGIRFLAGAALHIENCAIFGFSQNGLDVNLSQATQSRIFVTDSTFSNNTGGITARNATNAFVFVSVHRSNLKQNSSFGIQADDSGAGGILTTVSDSLISGNGTGVLAVGGAVGATIAVTRSTVANNVTAGLRSNGTAGFSNIFVSNTLILGNTTALVTNGGGTMQTYKNNATEGNFALGAFTTTLVPE